MIYEVSYLPQAEQDLIEILAYGIENWGEKLAESMYLKITDQLETLYFSPNRTKRKGKLDGIAQYYSTIYWKQRFRAK